MAEARTERQTPPTDIGGAVVAVFVKPRKSQRVVATDSLKCATGFGIEGDANAGAGDGREILLVSEESEAALGLAAGALWENITTRGIDADRLAPGTRLAVGQEVVLEITFPCDPCRLIVRETGVSLRALRGRRGVLAVVRQGGTIAAGDRIRPLPGDWPDTTGGGQQPAA